MRDDVRGLRRLESVRTAIANTRAGERARLARTVFSATLLFAYGTVQAQFGASGGPGTEIVLLLRLPWVFVVLVLLAGWIGPAGTRTVLRHAAKQAFFSYFCVVASLLICLLVLSALPGSLTTLRLSALGLLAASLVFSGALISSLLLASLAYGVAKAIRRGRRTKVQVK